MNISTPFVEFQGGQYQDGLMATCPVEETNEMLSEEIRVDDKFSNKHMFYSITGCFSDIICFVINFSRIRLLWSHDLKGYQNHH